jgi:hypothetical protein
LIQHADGSEEEWLGWARRSAAEKYARESGFEFSPDE